MNLKLIHQDNRGSIFSFTDENLKCPEITIFFTNERYARGGCIHNISDEYACVIHGEVEYVVGNKYYILNDGDSIKIPKATPHYFVSFSNSTVAEWGATEEEKKEKHADYRKIVDRINENRTVQRRSV